MNHNPVEQYRQANRQQEREQLILDNLPYVRKILSAMTVSLPAHADREALESAGVVGLVEAANSFDPQRGVKFKTFAYNRIKGAVLDELRKMSTVPQKTLQKIGLIKSAHERLPPPVTPELLAQETGLSLEEVHTCLEAMRFLTPQDWSDLYSTVHGSWRESEEQPEQRMDSEETRAVLAECIKELPERERLILTLYFAEDLTLAEIGSALNLSESYVSKQLAAAKFRLKELYRKRTS